MAGDDSAAHEAEHRALAAVDAAVVHVLLDAELAVGLERDQAVVGEADLRVARRAGDHGVAGVDRRARHEPDAIVAAHRGDVAHGEHHAASLRERRRRSQRQRKRDDAKKD